MKRFIATCSIFAATVMLVAMTVLPHHHHHEVLVMAHCACAGDIEHEDKHKAEHHNENSCEVNLFISSIIRDDINKNGSELIPENDFFTQFFTVVSLSSNPTISFFVEQTPLKDPPFRESLFTEYYPAAQGLRAPPCSLG